MKRPKKGPEINLSKLRSGDLKPPKAIGDLYRELKGQHLLPIVALLIIGLIAVPFLIGSSSDHKSAEVTPAATAGGSSAEPTALKVTKWTPGLLDYKKSLRGVHAVNPFEPRVHVTEGSESNSNEVEAAPEPSEIETPAGSEGGGGSGGEEVPAESPSTPHSPAEGESGEEAGHDESGAITIDVQVTTVHEDGGVDRAPVRRELPQLTKLPSESTPALTYVGPSEDGTKAMMAVSSEVTAMLGDSKCVVHAEPCSLLALQVGAPETIVFGPRGLTYRIELVRIGDHTTSVGKTGPNRTAPKTGQGTGTAPAPRGEADALIGVGSLHVVQRPLGL